jgi:hypothetical protein
LRQPGLHSETLYQKELFSMLDTSHLLGVCFVHIFSWFLACLLILRTVLISETWHPCMKGGHHSWPKSNLVSSLSLDLAVSLSRL